MEKNYKSNYRRIEKMKQNFKFALTAFLILVTTRYVFGQPSNSEPYLAGYPENFVPQNNKSIVFTENKGQIHDQDYKPRPDVLFSGTDGKLVYHLKNNGISYQLNRIDTWKEDQGRKLELKDDEKDELVPDQSTIYRLDANWINCNANATIKAEGTQEGYNNYYLANCPEGALNVKSYGQVTYQQIYTGIDLKWYQQDGHLKYDYQVSAGADYHKIQLEFKGAESIYLNEEGELVLKTPLGEIIEQVPFVTQSGKVLKAKWIVKGDKVSFGIENVDSAISFVIDPAVRAWGTYYGGTSSDIIQSCKTDNNNNIYISGSTDSPTGIATSGSHQEIIASGSDAFIAKFNSNGARLWGTYCGGNGSEYRSLCATDLNNNVFLCGYTESTTTPAIASIGCHQPLHGGGIGDAFIVKFNPEGVRLWGTYYGGTLYDVGSACESDPYGNVYLFGNTKTNIGTAIATVGSFQSLYGGGMWDAFLVKFNSSGVRQWGTYFGGNSTEESGISIDTDLLGDNVYISGWSASSSGIATPSSHQPTLSGGSDGFLAKFSSLGIRVWGTYLGGTSNESYMGCSVDGSNNVYLSGRTESTLPINSIATPGSHQLANAGGGDAFLEKFNASGIRQWGTYYGGTLDDYGYNCVNDVSGNVFLSGRTNSLVPTYSISTANGYQPVYGGGNADGFLVKFNAAGIRQIATYYGGSATDLAWGCARGVSGTVYLAGSTSSTTEIATPSSHQEFIGGNQDGFLIKFSDCALPVTPGPITGSVTVCAGTNANTYNVPLVSGVTYNWTLPVGWSGTLTGNSITPTVGTSSGTISVTATNGCGTSSAATFAVTVITIPATPGPITGPASVCAGSTTNIYSVPLISGVTYNWTIPSGWSGTLTGNAITPVVGTIGGNVTVTATNSCGTSPIASFAVSVQTIPAAPGVILTPNGGSNSMGCLGGTYSFYVNPVANATSYIWTWPSFWTAVPNGNSIQVTFTGLYNGTLSVTASNSCGVSGASTTYISVIAGSPATPGSIAGLATICYNSTNGYSIAPVLGADSYYWTKPSGWTGPPSITPTFVTTANSSSGNITVKAKNFCGFSPERVKAITAILCLDQEGGNSELEQTAFGDKNNIVREVEIYPNPNNGDFLFLKINSDSKVDSKIEIKIIDIFGKLIQDSMSCGRVSDINYEFKINTKLSHGIYFINVYINGQLLHSGKVSVIN